jgi:hypothetical protein
LAGVGVQYEIKKIVLNPYLLFILYYWARQPRPYYFFFPCTCGIIGAGKPIMNKYRFLFTGGGTGGHVYPNIAIYEALKQKYPEADFLYVGSKKGSEAGIIPALDQPMKFVTVPTRGLPQNIKSAKTFFSLALIILGAVKSFFILRKFRADLIIGAGVAGRGAFEAKGLHPRTECRPGPAQSFQRPFRN